MITIRQNSAIRKTEDGKTKIMVVKTDSICFLSDCYESDGYNYNYHRSIIENLYFDGKKAENTYQNNWYKIDTYPSKIEYLHTGKTTNARYELNDPEIKSEKYPAVIPYKDGDNFSEDVLDVMYNYTFDTLPDEMEDVTEKYDLDIVFEVEDYKPSQSISYKTEIKEGWSTKPYTITNANVNHQWFDRLVFPEVLLDKAPASFSSKQMYDITRQYIKDNIDTKQAKITSDYDFCFTVKKLVKYLEPVNYTYQNIFAKTKKARSKIHFGTSEYKEIQIFQMTHDQRNYDGYTAIPAMYANSDDELKEKVDTWLTSLVDSINTPLTQCPHCNGTGYADQVEPLGFCKDGDSQ